MELVEFASSSPAEARLGDNGRTLCTSRAKIEELELEPPLSLRGITPDERRNSAIPEYPEECPSVSHDFIKFFRIVFWSVPGASPAEEEDGVGI
tara:strand:- start:2663 stop:2944 length:282 start_codon:yes stop_codon:yes gene_type:complete